MPADSRAELVSPTLIAMLRCPFCKGPLSQEAASLRCGSCRKQYPVRLGIPDLRVYEDPLIPLEDDYAKGEKIEARAAGASFEELVKFYWSLPTYPPTPPELRDRFIHHVLTDEERVPGYIDEIGTGRAFLEAGCGTAALTAAALRPSSANGAPRFQIAIGCDVAFRWLLIARKRLEEAGLPAHLVCCCADYLPFDAGAFDATASISLLEHMADAEGAFVEFSRVTAPAGRVFAWTANRFSIGLEPHVRAWGVGFLPRRWMPAYVKWATGLAYEKKRLLSCFGIRRMLRGAGFAAIRFSLPRIGASDWVHVRGAERFGARIFQAASRIPLLRQLLTAIAPAILVSARKAGVREGRS